MEQSQETRIALLEQHNETIMEKIDAIIEQLNHFEEKLDKALDKKADVWVEKALTWFLYAVAAILVGAFMYLVIK